MSANGSCMLRVVLSPWKTYDVALTWSFKDRVAAAALQAHFLPCGGRATRGFTRDDEPAAEKVIEGQEAMGLARLGRRLEQAGLATEWIGRSS